MKKMTMIAAVIAATIGLQAQTNSIPATTNSVPSAWTVEIAPPQTATQLQFVGLRVTTVPEPTMVFIDWRWLDDKGKMVRYGTSRYTEGAVAALLATNGIDYLIFKSAIMSVGAAEAVAP